MEANVKRGTIVVANALAELGLDSEILREAILEGEGARDSCTRNDPPAAPGFDAWAKSVRRLREILIPKKWVRNDDGNYSTVVSPDGTIAIAVVTGSDGTGVPDQIPKVKHPKGSETKAAVDRNVRYLFPEMNAAAEREAAEREAAEKRITWMLLKRRDENTVFAELSLPAKISEAGQVEKWEVRIILEPTDVQPTIDVGDNSDSGDLPIDVPVRRRS